MGADPFSWAASGLLAVKSLTDSINASEAARDRGRAAGKKVAAAARTAESNARRIERQTAKARQAEQQQYRRARSGARVGLAKAGVSPGTGSALEYLLGSAAQNVKNQSDMERDGASRARRARNRASGAGYGASAGGRDTGLDLAFDVADSLLSLGARAYDGWNRGR